MCCRSISADSWVFSAHPPASAEGGMLLHTVKSLQRSDPAWSVFMNRWFKLEQVTRRACGPRLVLAAAALTDGVTAEKGEATHPSRRTSGRDRLRAIISEAMRLNWLILNISFIFSWFSFGITTGFPPSPGPSRGLLRESTDTHVRRHTLRGGRGHVSSGRSPRPAHPLSRAVLAP